MLVQTFASSNYSKCTVCANTEGFSKCFASTSTPSTATTASSVGTANSSTKPSLGSASTSKSTKSASNAEYVSPDGIENEHAGAWNQRKSRSNAHTATNACPKPNLEITNKKAQRQVKNIKRSNNLLQALTLPTLCNMNSRSVYNKVNEFHEFVINKEVDILFMSESWEREEETLKDINKLEDHMACPHCEQFFFLK